jgi:hypothetical protein
MYPKRHYYYGIINVTFKLHHGTTSSSKTFVPLHASGVIQLKPLIMDTRTPLSLFRSGSTYISLLPPVERAGTD